MSAVTATLLTAHEHIGFELGWDYAHHRTALPLPYAQEPSPLRHGWLAGQAAFATRTLPATRAVRQWLQLRLRAWLRGRSVELFQVTPNYLAQLEVSHCPITRLALSGSTLDASDASIDRVRNDAAYAAGNLAVMSTKANHAKAAHTHATAQQCAVEAETSGQEVGGLGADAWARIAVLCSFVEPLSHNEACAVPMRVLPPNRLRLFNPVQGLQAFVSVQLLTPGWARRVNRFEAMLPNPDMKRDFRAFFLALLPRVLEAGRQRAAPQARWAVEDAWRHASVQQRWTAFARQLSPTLCEALLEQAAAKGLAGGSVHTFSDAQATEGWQLATRGYVPHGSELNHSEARRARSNQGGRQHELAW